MESSTRGKKTGSKNKLKITITTNGTDKASIVPQAKLNEDNVTAGTSSSLKTDWAASSITDREKVKESDNPDFQNFITFKNHLDYKNGKKIRFFMKNNKICGKLQKMANFAAANLPLRPQKTTMTDMIYALSFIQI